VLLYKQAGTERKAQLNQAQIVTAHRNREVLLIMTSTETASAFDEGKGESK
jgi:hypothetical protein